MTIRTVTRFARTATGAVALLTGAALFAPAEAGSLGSFLRDATKLVDEVHGLTGQGGSGGGANVGAQAAGSATATPYNTAAAGRSRPIEQPNPRAHHLDWDTKFTATGLADRKLVGHDFLFYCPPAPSKLVPRRLIGTDRYAFHSVVCRVAVHAGRIDLNGGNVTVRMLEGNMRLTGSSRNGFTTKDGSSGIRTIVFVN